MRKITKIQWMLSLARMISTTQLNINPNKMNMRREKTQIKSSISFSLLPLSLSLSVYLSLSVSLSLSVIFLPSRCFFNVTEYPIKQSSKLFFAYSEVSHKPMNWYCSSLQYSFSYILGKFIPITILPPTFQDKSPRIMFY